MANDPTSSARRADQALAATGQNLRQAQQRLAMLLAAARLAASVRTRRVTTVASPSVAR
jgi:hypothetical protein